MVPTFEQLETVYADLLSRMSIKEGWKNRYTVRAKQILKNKSIYEEVENLTGVPWAMVAALHERESSCNFKTHLHNGDSLQRRTYHVPAGRPLGNPPFTWMESAEDALKMKGLHNISNWTPERICYEMERYNGFGYRMYHPGTLSPYLWSGTNLYSMGKYIADGRWSSSTSDPQLGTVPLYLTLLEQDEAEESIVLTKIDKKELVQVSKKLSFISVVKNFIKISVATILGFDYMGFLEQVKQSASDNKILTILIVGGVVYTAFKIIEKYIYQDYSNGTWTPSGMADGAKQLEDAKENVQP